ncbi:hypothetical protein ES703_18167 [subsurface metagenome]
MGDYDKKIEGQCGTCAFAKGFSYADCPSGPEDAVECTSLEQATMLDEQTNPLVTEDEKDPLYNQYRKELASAGSMNLWRLEALAEESFRCQNWRQK